MKIAFYKGSYKWYSKIVKKFTRSNFSHCEFYYNGQLIGISGDISNVRKKSQILNKDKWELYEISVHPTTVESFYNKTKGCKYDWLGIVLGLFFNFRIGSKTRYTCSEWVAECLDSELDCFYPKNYITITPQDIYELVLKKGGNKIDL